MAVQLVAGVASQLINTSTNITLPVQLPALLAVANKNGFSVNVWINANWGTSGAPRGTKSFVGIYGPVSRTQGVVATYWDNKLMTDPAIGTRLEANVNMTTLLSGVSPWPGVVPNNDIYSIRWSGYFNPPTSGVYYFRTNTDDGVRVYINNVLVINNWTDHSATVNTSATPGVTLTAGNEVPIVVEYYNQGGDGVCTLTYGIGTTTVVATNYQALPATSLNTSAPVAGGTYTAVQIGTTTGAGEITAWTYGGGVLVTTPTNFNPAANNTWINVCYTWNGSTHLLYVNGEPVVSGSATQIPGNLKYITINGYLAGAAGETDNHYVDAYTLYNRVLTPDEVQTIYNADGARHGIVNGLVAAYEFDERADGVNVAAVSDLTGGGATLLMTGAGTAPKYSYINSHADSNIRPPVTT